MFRQSSDQFEILASYLDRTSKFCPFLNPSNNEGKLFFTKYIIEGSHINELQEKLFCYGIAHTELLRILRKLNTKHPYLYCENIIFDVLSDSVIDGKELFSWPHWCLKVLYTNAGVLFGKFWSGEKDVSRDGSDLPIPPIHFLSIRSAIKSKDFQFFNKAQQLLPELQMAEDREQNVFEKMSIDIKVDFAGFDLEDQSRILTKVEEIYTYLMDNHVYGQVLELAKQRI